MSPRRRAAVLRSVPRAGLLLVGLSACASDPEPAADAPGTTTVRPGPVAPSDPTAPTAPARVRPGATADPSGPVTHLGRTVFPRCHRMSVAEVAEKAALPRGAEMVRLRETEVLWGPPLDDPPNVVCGAAGLAPGPGGKALFLLRLLPSGSYEAVQISPLDDADGPARLAAFRRYLEIEAIPDPAARRTALVGYLRGAVSGERGWTRANALREYAALSSAFPSALGPADAEVLARAASAERNAELKRLAQAALDRVPAGGRSSPGPAEAGNASAPAPADLSAFERRFVETKGGPGPRREALIDAAARHGAAAAPLVERALADEDPILREAAAAVAGEAGMAALGPRLAELLRTEPSAPVRRSLVLALGHLRVESAVPLLGSYAAEGGALARESAFALARIRTSGAVERLERLARDESDAERASLARFLLSEDFVRQERALGARWAEDAGADAAEGR